MKGWIKNIKINPYESNSCYKTVDDLICDVCNKKTDSVIVLASNNNPECIKFACVWNVI